MADERKRILTGVRPTGALHLGHYAGALENWIRLQEEYECFFLIADYQVSDHADDIELVRESVLEVARDWLAVGLDPERSHFVIESLVPEHAELTTWLSWFIGLGRLERNPTLKAEMEELEERGIAFDDADRAGKTRVVRERGAVAGGVLHVPDHAGREHPDAARPPRAGRRGPAAAHRADARGGAALQPPASGRRSRSPRASSGGCRGWSASTATRR